MKKIFVILGVCAVFAGGYFLYEQYLSTGPKEIGSFPPSTQDVASLYMVGPVNVTSVTNGKESLTQKNGGLILTDLRTKEVTPIDLPDIVDGHLPLLDTSNPTPVSDFVVFLASAPSHYSTVVNALVEFNFITKSFTILYEPANASIVDAKQDLNVREIYWEENSSNPGGFGSDNRFYKMKI